MKEEKKKTNERKKQIEREITRVGSERQGGSGREVGTIGGKVGRPLDA